MTTYSAKNITFTNKFTRIPDIKLIFKDASDNILTAPVNATNLSTTGFTIPSFESALPITKCNWTAGGVIQGSNYTLIVTGIGSGAVGTITINNVLQYNRSGYSGDSGDFTGTFANNSTVEIHWGVEMAPGVPTMSINNTQVTSGNPMQYTFTLTGNTTVVIDDGSPSPKVIK